MVAYEKALVLYQRAEKAEDQTQDLIVRLTKLLT